MAKEQSSPFLLSDSERTQCTRIAQMKIVPHSQRATALLLIESGLTHREAGTKVGLSIGQVRYALNRFRKRGMAIFPPPVGDKEAAPQEVKREEDTAVTKKRNKGKKKKLKKEKEKKNVSDSKKKKGGKKKKKEKKKKKKK